MDGQNQKGTKVGITTGIRGVAPYAILLAIFMAGFTISQTLWTSSNSQLQANYQQLQRELETVKAEYAAYRAQYGQPNTVAIVGTPALSSVTPNASGTAPISTPTPNPNKTEAIVAKGYTEYLFDDDLVISVVTTSFIKGSGDEWVYKVTATLGSPGKPNLPIELQDIGYATIYTGTYPYEVRITRANSFTASFDVTKLK